MILGSSILDHWPSLSIQVLVSMCTGNSDIMMQGRLGIVAQINSSYQRETTSKRLMKKKKRMRIKKEQVLRNLKRFQQNYVLVPAEKACSIYYYSSM